MDNLNSLKDYMDEFNIGNHRIKLTFNLDCLLLFQLEIDGKAASVVDMNYLGHMTRWKHQGALIRKFRYDRVEEKDKYNHHCIDVRYVPSKDKMAKLGCTKYESEYGFTEQEFWELHKELANHLEALGWNNCYKCMRGNQKKIDKA